MEADINFNPCVPLIVGYVVGFASSIYPSVMNRRLNKDGVIYKFSHVNNSWSLICIFAVLSKHFYEIYYEKRKKILFH